MITHKHFFLLRCTWQLVFEMPHAWFTLAVQVNSDALKLLDLSWCIAVCLQAFILALKWKTEKKNSVRDAYNYSPRRFASIITMRYWHLEKCIEVCSELPREI